jgi:vancomycin permeability regulator SanA
METTDPIIKLDAPEKIVNQLTSQPKKVSKRNWFATILKLVIVVELVILGPFLIMNLRTFGIERPKNPSIRTALVLGAGLNNKKPSTVLELRLDKAARMYRSGQVSTLLVSGTNTSIYYNEPLAMKLYLIEEWKVRADDIIMDFGGRRTIDSCWRAKNVFKLQGVYVVTQAYHLARTYYLCRQSGLTTIPIIANDTRLGVERDGFFREILATWEALKNTNSITDSDNYVPAIKGDGSEEDLSGR